MERTLVETRTMQTTAAAEAASRKQTWAARILTGIPIAFLLLDGAMKLVKPAVVVEGTVALGYSESAIVPLGIVLLGCTVLYALPRTAILGAILLTGYLGGAVATHVRVGDPLFTHILFPTYLGILIWGGLYLRDARVRTLLPVRG
jgi:DoxX-like family